MSEREREFECAEDGRKSGSDPCRGDCVGESDRGKSSGDSERR